MSRWSWILSRIVRQIWFRAALISVLAVVVAMVAAFASRWLPFGFDTEIGQDSVGTILEIMASSMLAVTTFSLTAMVSAYSSAAQLATPRATQLLMDDTTSQNVLSTFLGAFVFAIVGIVGLQSGLYGETGRILLFGATVAIVAWVVVTLLRWIGHIIGFGRMGDVIDRVEQAAASAMADYVAEPDLCGRPAVPIPDDATAIVARETGYVTHIDVGALGRIAECHALVVHVAALPGAMVHPARALLRIEGTPDEEVRDELVDAFTLERHRSFDQDPRLGLIALSEIASRALAPATNDPGTAIEVLNALLRVLLRLPADELAREERADRPRVHVPRPTMEDFLTDAFRPILREGARETEVAIRLTGTLAALHAALPAARGQLRALADQCADRCQRESDSDADRAAFDTAHAAHWS